MEDIDNANEKHIDNANEKHLENAIKIRKILILINLMPGNILL